MNADNKQVDGTHYKTGGMEHWTLVSGCGIGYLEGSATKYLLRWRNKNGMRDLLKAEHFLEKLLEMVGSGAIRKNQARLNTALLKNFYLSAKIPYPESLICDSIFHWHNSGDIAVILKRLREFIDEVEGGPTAGYVNQDA